MSSNVKLLSPRLVRTFFLWGVYFRISLARDKNKWGKLSLLLISRCAPFKVRYQRLNFDCKCYYITPALLFCFNYNVALLGAIFPIYCCPLQTKFLSIHFVLTSKGFCYFNNQAVEQARNMYCHWKLWFPPFKHVGHYNNILTTDILTYFRCLFFFF